MFVKPVPHTGDNRKMVVTSGFGPRTGGLYDFHYGADIVFPSKPGDPTGLPQRSSNGKWVMYNGWPAVSVGPGKVIASKEVSTGGYVAVDHGGGLVSKYMHLKNRAVKKGDGVTTGKKVGDISYSVYKPGVHLNHLHFELWKNGSAVDPKPYLEKWPSIARPDDSILMFAIVGAVGYGAYRIWKG